MFECKVKELREVNDIKPIIKDGVYMEVPLTEWGKEVMETIKSPDIIALWERKVGEEVQKIVVVSDVVIVSDYSKFSSFETFSGDILLRVLEQERRILGAKAHFIFNMVLGDQTVGLQEDIKAFAAEEDIELYFQLLVDRVNAQIEKDLPPVVEIEATHDDEPEPKLVFESIFTPTDPIEREDAIEEDLLRVPMFAGKKRNEVTAPFLAQMSGYSLDEYISAVKKNIRNEEWLLLSKFFGQDVSLARLMYKLQRQYRFLEVLFGDNERVTEAVRRMDKDGYVQKSKLPAEYNQVDHVVSRLEQANRARETVLRVSYGEPNYESDVFVNLFAPEDPIYVAPDSSTHVNYVVGLDHVTNCVVDYVKRVDSSKEHLVPKTNHFSIAVTDEEFDNLVDLSTASKAEDPALLAIRFDTQGGLLFGDQESFDAYYEMPPLALVMGQGLPAIYKVKAIHDHDKVFRDQWKEHVKTAVAKRQAHLTDEFPRWFNHAKSIHSRIRAMRKTGLVQTPSKEKYDHRTYVETVNMAHDANRSMIKLMSTDMRAFLALNARVKLFPSESFPIRVANDLLFQDLNLTLFDAHNYVGVGYITEDNHSFRPKMREDDNTSLKNEKLRMHDTLRNGKAGLIDMRWVDTDQVFYIGGGEFEDKINKKSNEKRQALYWDFEKDEGHWVNDDLIVKAPVKESSKQYHHAVAQFEKAVNLTYSLVGCIVPIRYAVDIMEKYNVLLILQAPMPAIMSVYMVVTAGPPKRQYQLAQEFAQLMFLKANLVLTSFQYGCKGYKQMMTQQLTPHTLNGFGTLVEKWVETLGARHTSALNKLGTSNWIVKQKLTCLLRTSKNIEKKGELDRVKKRNQHFVSRIPRLEGE